MDCKHNLNPEFCCIKCSAKDCISKEINPCERCQKDLVESYMAGLNHYFDCGTKEKIKKNP